MAKKTVIERQVATSNIEPFFVKTASGTIPTNRLVEVDSNGKVIVGTNNSTRIIGAYNVSRTAVSGDTVNITYAAGVVEADVAIPFGAQIKSGANGRAVPFLDGTSTSLTINASAGGNAAAQPANDITQVLSSSAGDTTQIVTLYGTTNATNTVVVQTVALNGTTPVDSAKSDWGQILGVSLSAACVGTITIRKKTGAVTIITLAPAVLTAGIVTVTGASQVAYNAVPAAVASGASTKQIGIQGTDNTGATIYDSQALNGTTPVVFTSAFRTVTAILNLDVASGTTATVRTSATQDDYSKLVGRNVEAASVTQGDVIKVLFA